MHRLGTKLGDSVDSEGRERFHPLSIEDHYFGFYPSWLQKYSGKAKVQKGLEAISTSSISFHYMYPKRMALIDRIWRDYKASTDQSKDFHTSVILKYIENYKKSMQS